MVYTEENFRKALKGMSGETYLSLLDDYLSRVAGLKERGIKSGFLGHNEWAFNILTGQETSVIKASDVRVMS